MKAPAAIEPLARVRRTASFCRNSRCSGIKCEMLLTGPQTRRRSGLGVLVRFSAAYRTPQSLFTLRSITRSNLY
ncbi:hypothetical protein NDU88_007828 [Pleurodeles waltl]|uniref:Uncharacterized protein n=1 Tax=Pleurodeles waltl TaxID=8319 RepID=A0AAV7STF6_PLEWA|nr:hypothetical protein NDU88_007828 [Pleurodeles waltl]